MRAKLTFDLSSTRVLRGSGGVPRRDS